MPAELIARVRAPIVALVHHPLCLEAGLSPSAPDAAAGAGDGGAGAGASASSSPARPRRARCAADFARRRRARSPSPSPAPIRRSARDGHRQRPLQLLAVGSIVPRKAYDILVRALGPLADRDWRLTIAGPTDRSAEALAALQRGHARDRLAAIASLSLGAVSTSERLAELYASADVFVMPSLYEGYGMVLAEAMARGLPIVCTTGGAAAETAPDAAAIKVPPGDEARAHRRHRPPARRARPAPPHGRCGLGRRPETAALGGYGAHHRRRHRGSWRP